MTRPVGGCVYCVYALPAGGGSKEIPTVSVARQSVQTPRGVRPLCNRHASLFLTADSQNVDTPPFSAGRPQ